MEKPIGLVLECIADFEGDFLHYCRGEMVEEVLNSVDNKGYSRSVKISYTWNGIKGTAQVPARIIRVVYNNFTLSYKEFRRCFDQKIDPNIIR